MPAKPKFRSDAFEAIHSSVSGILQAGTIDKATMRHFDETCLTANRHQDSARERPDIGSRC